MIRRRTPLKRTRIKRKPRPKTVGAQKPNARKYRNVDPRGLLFLEFVKRFPCVLCYFEHWVELDLPASELLIVSRSGSEAAHVGGNHAAKASNYSAFPLCDLHHRVGAFCHENMKKRWGTFHGVDVHAIIAKLRAYFDVLFPEQTQP